MTGHFFIYEPEVAGRMISREPEKCWLRMPDLIKFLGITPDEILADLRSGDLVATGTKVADGYADIAVRGDQFLTWIAKETPTARKAREFMSRPKEKAVSNERRQVYDAVPNYIPPRLSPRDDQVAWWWTGKGTLLIFAVSAAVVVGGVWWWLL